MGSVYKDIKDLFPRYVWMPYSSKRGQMRATLDENSRRKVLAGVANYSIELTEWIQHAIDEGWINIEIPPPIERYDAGNGVLVTASGTTVTTQKFQGVVYIEVPEDVLLISFRTLLTSNDLSNGEIRIIVDGGKLSGVDYNTNDINSYYPTITIQNRNVILPSENFQQQPIVPGGSISIFNERYNTSGRSTIKVTGLAGTNSIMGQF